MYRHIYDWNIVNCDVKQQIQLNSTHIKIGKRLLAGSKLEEDQSRDWKVAGSNPAFGEPWADARKKPLLSMARIPGSTETGLCPVTMYS